LVFKTNFSVPCGKIQSKRTQHAPEEDWRTNYYSMASARSEWTAEERQRGRAMTLSQQASRDPEFIYNQAGAASKEPSSKRRKKTDRPFILFIKTQDGASTTFHIKEQKLTNDLKLMVDSKGIAVDGDNRRIKYKDLDLVKGQSCPAFLKKTNLLLDGVSLAKSGLVTGATLHVTRREEPREAGSGLLDVVVGGPLTTICTFLTVSGVASAGTTSKAFKEFSYDNDLWHSLCTSQWPNSRGLRLPSFRNYFLKRVCPSQPTNGLAQNNEFLEGLTLLLDISSQSHNGGPKTPLCSVAVPLSAWADGEIVTTWNTSSAVAMPLVDDSARTTVEALILRQSDAKMLQLPINDASESDTDAQAHYFYHSENPNLAVNNWWGDGEAPTLTTMLCITLRQPGGVPAPALHNAVEWECADCTFMHRAADELQAPACSMCGNERAPPPPPPQPANNAPADGAADEVCIMSAKLEFEVLDGDGDGHTLRQKNMLVAAMKAAEWA
jgi:hypothetical protein